MNQNEVSNANEVAASVDRVVIWLMCWNLLLCVFSIGCNDGQAVVDQRSHSKQLADGSVFISATAIEPWNPCQGLCYDVRRMRGPGGQWVKVSERGFVDTDATFWIEVIKWDNGTKVETREIEMDFYASDQTLIRRAFPDCGENPELFH